MHTKGSYVNMKPKTPEKPFNLFMLIDPAAIAMMWHKPKVEKGAAWLDEYEPGWVRKIVPEELNLMSTDMCICGQMFGCYSQRPEAVCDAHDYGFNFDETGLGEFVSDYEGNCLYFGDDTTWQALSFKALDILWLDEVFWRAGFYDVYPINNPKGHI
jgi:hypothetical protein